MSKRINVFIVIGLLLLAAALCLTIYNVWDDLRADSYVKLTVEELSGAIKENAPAVPSDETPEHAYLPDYIIDPEIEMPSKTIDGEGYIGILQIPDLALELPVNGDWSYPKLKNSPCRYSGSIYLNNMVIAAHNYTSHFGELDRLSPGDAVLFTDMDGNVFSYEVSEIEVLSPYAIGEMTSGEWDLTLFTCTLSGQSRITVRCEFSVN